MMNSRRYYCTFALATLVMLAAQHARAFSFTLNGPEPPVPSATDLTSTIWASLPGGTLVRVAAIGKGAPGGGKFTEMGVPSISPEGQVIFGAEVTSADGVARWEIFRGDLTAPPGRGVTRAIVNAAAKPGCVPNIRFDPYPVAGSNGTIAFIAPEARGSDALFRYANRELTCATRVGEKTAEGHVLRMVRFGSAAMAPTGEVAFIGRIDDNDGRDYGAGGDSRLAMIIASPDGSMRSMAIEGSRAPIGLQNAFGFGLPAVVSTPRGPIVAFTATFSRNGSREYALYVSRNGKSLKVLASGDRTSIGPVTFLSNGRPALSASGEIAVRGACANRRAIYSIHDGNTMVVITPGHRTEVGSRIVTFGDPVVSAAGRIMFGIIDSEDRNLLYAVNPANVRRVSLPPVIDGELVEGLNPQIFAGTLVINESGAFAFIGGKSVEEGSL
jgi:hypothetical protein